MTKQINTKKQQEWERKLKDFEFKVWRGGRTDDIIIAIMGASGAGKSSFVNHVLGRGAQLAPVGGDLSSCTQTVTAYPTDFGGKRIVLVDTPGFDDTYLQDTDILKQISVWLATCYGDGRKLSALLCMHDITEPRMTGTGRKYLEMFTALCGPKGMKSVMLVTTKWDDLRAEEVGENREKQLLGSFWGDLIDHGAIMKRSYNTDHSAIDIIRDAIDRDGRGGVFQIQRELVDQSKVIRQTDAGRKLHVSLQEGLRIKVKQAAVEGGPNLSKTFQELSQIQQQVNELAPVGLLERISAKFHK